MFEAAAINRSAGDLRRTIGAAFGFCLIAFFVIFGALGVAIGVVITAALALPRWRHLRTLFPLDLSHSALLVFIAWAWLSAIWSPQQTNQALYIALGAFVYPLFVYAIYVLPADGKQILVKTALISGGLMLLPYLAEGSFGLISHFIYDQAKQEAMLRDATRGISAVVMVMPALVVLVMQTFSGPKGQIMAAIATALVLLICIQFQLFAGIVALVFGGAAFMSGLRWPRPTLLALTLMFLLMVLLAPMVMPTIAALLDNVSLPFSWEWRVKMWAFTGEQIGLHPLFGWGLEASRSFTDYRFTLHGFTLEYLSSHPHNLGLQVWLETGMVGALLLSAAIALFGIRLSTTVNFSLNPLYGAAITGSCAVVLVFLSITYGAWQEWLWANIAWVAALCVLSARHIKS